ncbi:MAG: hypothetical protein JST04_07235 [Bdellovibrionales bacterium]|nr:hypothetical protein [Bdellovibrionales bacterium]
MTAGKKTIAIALLTAALLFAFREHLHFDPASYSAGFADSETRFGVPNFWNVATNLGFLLLGVLGFRRRAQVPAAYRGLGAVFSLAVAGTAFGSSYFHYAPSPATLFWDQLPMSVGFASFVGMVVADRANAAAGRALGIALVVLGPLSVANIYFGTGATEFYLALQFGSLLFAILVLAVVHGGEMRTSFILVGLFAYILAKVFERQDAAIYARLGFSGHSLKHLAATVAIAAILRGVEGDRNSA